MKSVDETLLVRMYQSGLRIDDICSDLGVSRTGVYERLRRLGVPRTRNQDRESSKIRIDRLRAHVKEHLQSHPCTRCSHDDWRVLQFDHRDRDNKAFTIGKVLRKSGTTHVSILQLKAEIKKCDVLCANCHSLRTAKQFGFWRASS